MNKKILRELIVLLALYLSIIYVFIGAFAFFSALNKNSYLVLIPIIMCGTLGMHFVDKWRKDADL